MPRRSKQKKSQLIRVTRLEIGQQILIGERWYTVKDVDVIGEDMRKKTCACIVFTLEKGGMHFRANKKVVVTTQEV